MKKTTAFKRYVFACAVSVVAMLSTSMAQADLIICANPIVSGQNHQFQTTGASDCVWSNDANIGNGGGNDKFLNGLGTNDAAYGNPGPTFGLTWAMIESKDASSQGIPVNLSGLTFSSGATAQTFTWTLIDDDYGQYALGLKGGSDPSWAVFLLSSTSGTANLGGNGSWSHIVLYGTGTPDDGNPPPAEIPEPGTLALVGLALLGGVALRRRRT